MKKLVIAEKSSAGKDMARVLGLTATDMKDGYMENDNYIVAWARGHLVGQLEPIEIYGKEKAWSLDLLPFQIDQEKQLKIIDDKGSGAIFNILKKLINRDDVECIINAGDCGREGELIQQWIYKMAGNKKPIKRLWVNDLTDESLKKGFANLQDNDKYKNMFEEGKALKVIDWMYGMSYTVLLTKLYSNGAGVLHYGRCQTPLLNLIVEREKEIRNFKKEKYNVLKANYGNFKGIKLVLDEEIGKYQNDQIKFNNDNEKTEYLNNWKQYKTGKVIKFEQKNKETKPDRCFSLSTLQQTLGKKYGYTPDKTLELAQSLYEKKYTTYPRTNSEFLSEELWAEKDKHIDSCIELIKSFCGDVIIDKNKTASKDIVNNSEIEDHHAIIPTDQVANINSLNEEEKNAYIEICKRFLALFVGNYKYKATEIQIEINGAIFKTTGTQETDIGYKILYTKDEKEEKVNEENEEYSNLPIFNVGDNVDIKDYELKELETKPKQRYNVSSIIKIMEKYGIGTPATQSGIIENILNQKVVEIISKGKKKEYAPTEKGEKLIDIIPDELKSSDLTKRVEERIKEVGKGKVSVATIKNEIFKEQQETIEKLKEDAKTNTTTFSSSFTKEPIGKCPFCGKDMVINSKGNLLHIDYKDNPCKFTIWKESLFTTISEKMMKELLIKGKTVGSFKSKAGKTYKQEILLDKEKKTLVKGDFVNSASKQKSKQDKELEDFVNDFEKELIDKGIIK